MKRLLLFSALMLCLIFPVHAQDDGLGLGIMIGNPDGIALKYFVTETIAFDTGVGAKIGTTTIDANGNKRNEGSRIYLHGDLLFHNFEKIQSTEEFPVYAGFGLAVESGGGDDDAVSVRAVVGLEYIVQQAPLDLFFELAPQFQLDPSNGFGLGASIGARYYF